jgi:hypothetical protein
MTYLLMAVAKRQRLRIIHDVTRGRSIYVDVVGLSSWPRLTRR